MEAGTLGSNYNGDNPNSGEDGTASYGVVGFCGSDNFSVYVGMYIGGPNVAQNYYCMNPTGAWGLPPPGGVGTGALMIAPQSLAPADVSVIEQGDILGPMRFFQNPSTSGNCFGFNLAGGIGFGFAQGSCESDKLWGLVWNSTANSWDLDYWGTGLVMRYAAPTAVWNGGYTGYNSTTPLIDFPPGVLLNNQEDITSVGNERLYDAGSTLPTGTYHQKGDIRFNTNPGAGGPAGWIDLSNGANFAAFGATIIGTPTTGHCLQWGPGIQDAGGACGTGGGGGSLAVGTTPITGGSSNYVLYNNAGTLGNTNAPTFASLTVSGISGSTQCLHANSSGVVSGTGSDCGSGGGGGSSLTFNDVTINGTTTINQINPIPPALNNMVNNPLLLLNTDDPASGKGLYIMEVQGYGQGNAAIGAYIIGGSSSIDIWKGLYVDTILDPTGGTWVSQYGPQTHGFYEDGLDGTTFYTSVPENYPGVVTITIASPAVVTLANHNSVAGRKVYFKTNGTLPTGIVANTIYCVSATGLTTNTFRLQELDLHNDC